MGKWANRTLCLGLPKILLVSCKNKPPCMQKAAVYPARLSCGYSWGDSESVLYPKRTDTNLSIHALKHTHSFPQSEGRWELPGVQHKHRKRKNRRGSKPVQTSAESGVKGQHPANGSASVPVTTLSLHSASKHIRATLGLELAQHRGKLVRELTCS